MITFKSMLRILTIAVFLVSFTSRAQDIETHFGVSLMPSFQGVVSYAVVFVKDGEVVSAEPMTRDQWVRQAAGEMSSKGNPERENLFIKNKVDSCWVLYDSIYWTYGKKKYVGSECIPLNHLWRLRYKEHPYEYDNSGWSNGDHSPSMQQLEFLMDTYGLKHLDAYIYGPNMWRLLREIQTPSWQMFYKAGGSIEDYKDYFEPDDDASNDGDDQADDQ